MLCVQATGKKKTAKQESSTDALPPAQALLLVGDVGLDKFRSGQQYLKQNKGLTLGFRPGFDNLSPLADIIQQQQQAAKNK